MKKSIKEELERMHQLTYGDKTLNESFIDDLLKLLGVNSSFKKDEPNKADFITDNVDDFYKTLENAKIMGGFDVQPKGNMEYQKGVEAMQIGLDLLGYKLPNYGVDGLFGDETLNAVNNFKKDNNIGQNSVTESYQRISEITLMSPLKGGIGTSGGNYGVVRPGLDKKGHPHSGLDLHARYEQVLSPADGVVIDSATRDNRCGGTLYIDHKNGFQSRYCHLKQIYVNKGDTVKQGQEVAMSGGGKDDGISRGISTGPHLHFELYKDGRLVNPRDYIGTAVPAGTGIEQNLNKEDSKNATPEMLGKLIEKVKLRGVTSDDLKKYIDKSIVSDYKGSTDDDFYKAILRCIGAPITAENMLFMYAWRQSEGGTYKNNPFNTKRKYTNASGEGVKDYMTPQDGINATCESLKLSYYSCIVDSLKNDIGALNISQICDSSLYKWGTHHTTPLVTKVLKSYKSGAIPKPKPIQV